MADMWEMIIVRMDSLGWYTPEEYVTIGNREFIMKHKEQIKLHSGNFREGVICLLLSEGWEPYGSRENEFLFRRKFQG